MPASFIFATAPRQAGASRGSGHKSRVGAQVEGRGAGRGSGRKSRVGANQGGFVGRRKTRRQSRQGRPKRLPAKATGKINCARAATQNGGAKKRQSKQGRPKRWGGRKRWGGSGEGRGKKIRLAHSGDGFFNRDSLPNGSRHSRTPDPASSPLPRYILGCSPQSERSPRSESAMSGPSIRELATLEEGS